jgi:cation-transporting ATPase E
VLDLEGLTEEEAAARQLEGQDNAIRFKPPYSPRQIWRGNTLTIFNLSMVGLAVVQVLLGKPFDAVLTTGVMLLGIGLNTGQQLWARGRLQELEQSTRPQATVVRGGVVRSVDPGEVVQGDVLVVGPGDQILADGQVLSTGQLIVDESMLTGDPRQHTRQAGEPVYAGSFCLAGHGAYEAQKVGNERLIAALTGEFQAVEEELTPLERTMDRLLRVLLVIVVVLALLLLADYFDLLFPGIHLDAFASAASVIFSIAPSSLFLMILVNYAMGTADLARIGALVHRTRSVESMAQSTVVCFAQAGILTGVGVQMEPIEPPGDWPPLAESRIRQIVGDYVRNMSFKAPAVAAMAAAFPGSRRVVREQAPFLSLYGWSSIAFDDADLHGVYVLGDPELLEAHLVADDAESEEVQEDEPSSLALRERLDRLHRSFTRTLAAATASNSQSNQDPDASGSSPLQGLATRITQALGRQEDKTLGEETSVPPAEGKSYLLAYHPELASLHAADGTPCLPERVVPLCRLRYAEQVHPEVTETARAFFQAGVTPKVFSPEEPQRIAAMLKQAGLSGEDDASLRSISGPELAVLGRKRFTQAAIDHTILGQVTPEQAGQVVEALREQGEVVTVVGDGINDLAAMRQAHLSVTRKSSSPAALSVADIILLEDSTQSLLRVLDKGQRIANGLLDILKLYLNQIAYLTLLVLVIWGADLGFPYQSKQASLITIVSVILPSLALSLWPPAGVVARTHLGRLLARFVAPAAVTMGAVAVVVYIIFLEISGEVAYAQLTITYTLVISGLVLVVLLRPPVRGLTLMGMGGDERSGDWRPTVMVMVLLILVFAMASIPLADNLFGLKPLQQPTDYLVVGLAVLAWASTTVFLWWVRPLERLWLRLYR